VLRSEPRKRVRAVALNHQRHAVSGERRIQGSKGRKLTSPLADEMRRRRWMPGSFREDAEFG
jgi:hypothetical protein